MRLILISLFSALSLASAERTVSAVFFDAPPNAPKKMFAHIGKESFEIALPSMNLSDRIEIPSGEVVMQMTHSPVPEGTVIPPTAPSVRIPEDWADVVLLVAANPQSQGDFPIKILPVNASPGVFKPGQLLFFNLTKAQLAGKLGSSTLRVKAGSSVVVDPPAKADEDYPVEIDYLPPNSTEPLPLSRTVWRNEVQMRHLMFILDDKDRMVPRIWSVPLRPTPPKKDAESAALSSPNP